MNSVKIENEEKIDLEKNNNVNNAFQLRFFRFKFI
jgi:hypothetical protein